MKIVIDGSKMPKTRPNKRAGPCRSVRESDPSLAFASGWCRNIASSVVVLILFSGWVNGQEPDPEVRGAKLSEWIRVLQQDPVLRKRQAALLILEASAAKSKMVWPAVIKEARGNSEPLIRARCVALLPKIKDQNERVSETISAALRDDKSANVRAAAAASAGKLERNVGFPLVPNLTAALKDTDAATRVNAAESLARFSGIDSEVAKEAVPNLIACLKDREADVRRAAAFALARMGSLAEPAVPALTELVAGDPQKAVRKEAAKTLGGLGPKAVAAVPALIKSLQDSDAEIRLQSAITLGQIGPDASAALPELIKATKEKNNDVRCEAIHSLGRLGKAGHAAIPDLIRIVRDDEVAEVRLAAIQELGEFGPDAKEAIDALTVASKDGRLAIREAAADALKKIRKQPG